MMRKAGLWQLGMTVVFFLSFSAKSIGADRYSYDINSGASRCGLVYKLAFIADKVLIKSHTFSAIDENKNRGLVVPRNVGEIRQDFSDQGTHAVVTAAYFSEGPVQRIRIHQVSRFPDNTYREFTELSLHVEAGSCRVISYAYDIIDDRDRRRAGASLSPRRLSGYSCVQRPISSFQEYEQCNP